MISLKLKTFTLALLGFALLLIFPLSAAMAQNEAEPIGGDRGVDVVAGPHNVRVVMINSNLAAGFIQMAFFITDANTGEIVSDARVVIMANNPEEAYEGWGTAHNSPGNPRRYDGRMNLGSTGKWDISIDVSSSLGQGGTKALSVEVPALNRYTNGSLVFFAIFAAMGVGIAYLFWSTKRENRRRSAALAAAQEAPGDEPQS